MPSLVEEVQAAALDKSTPLSEVLLKAKALTVKLGAPELREWIENESHGYTLTDADLPPYRIVLGRPRFFNPYNGYCPINAKDPEIQTILSTAYICEGVASIETTISTSKSPHLPYSAKMVSLINQHVNLMGMQPSIQLSRGALVGILDKVRGIVLDWALDLESQGVVGKGITFSKQDKEKAAIVNNNTYVTNHIGTMTNSQLQQASEYSTQTQSNIDFGLAAQLAEGVKNSIDQFNLDHDMVVHLNGELDTINTNLKAPEPNIEIIRPAFRSVRNILEGATGSVLATEYATEISAFLGSLPV